MYHKHQPNCQMQVNTPYMDPIPAWVYIYIYQIPKCFRPSSQPSMPAWGLNTIRFSMVQSPTQMSPIKIPKCFKPGMIGPDPWGLEVFFFVSFSKPEIQLHFLGWHKWHHLFCCHVFSFCYYNIYSYTYFGICNFTLTQKTNPNLSIWFKQPRWRGYENSFVC